MIIDLARLAAAEDHYRRLGYKPVETPWIVGSAAYFATAPEGAVPFVTLGGYLVASGEQGFMQQMAEGRMPGRAFTTTPCFRHDHYDELHQPYFMKIELIDTSDVSEAGLARVISEAKAFFEQFLPVAVEKLDDGSFDLVAKATGIELGSYGIREKLGCRWVYGTGLAEPRLGIALNKAAL